MGNVKALVISSIAGGLGDTNKLKVRRITTTPRKIIRLDVATIKKAFWSGGYEPR